MEGDDTPVKRQRTSLLTFANNGNRPYGDTHISPTSERVSNHITALNDDKTDPSPKRASSHDGIRSSTRASFISPTRASLARFNPHLLPPSTRSDRKLIFPAGSSIQRNWDDSRPELNGEKILVNGSVTPVIVVEGRSGTNGENMVAETAHTTPDSKVSAKTDILFNTPPKRKPQTPQIKVPTTAQSQASPASGVRDSLPRAPDDSQEGLPTTIRVHLDAEPQNGALADENSKKDLIEKEDVYAHESESLNTHPKKRLFGGLSEVAKPTPFSISKELGHEAVADPPEGFLFSSPSLRPWGMKQPDLNSSPPAPSHSSFPISGAPSLKPRIGLGPRKLITKNHQFDLSVVPV